MKHARHDYDRIQDPSGAIPADEPVFLLRGQDVSAPVAVRAWADDNDRVGGDPKLSSLARRQADAMEFWQEKRAWKVADAP